MEIDQKRANVVLRTGKKIENTELRGGTVVGKTESGGEYKIALSSVKAITTTEFG